MNIKRQLFFAYGLLAYALFAATAVYGIGFLGNFMVPKTINSGEAGPMLPALLINTGLIALFGLQHSIMARPAFKRRWTRLVPEPIERSTYVIFSSAAMLALFFLWQPLPAVIWDIAEPAGRMLMYTLYGSGWLIVIAVSCLINHFDLFGVRQVYYYLKGQEYPHLKFVTPGPYRLVRHPLYIGWLLAFWATPTMTLGHFILATAILAYILVAIRFEERDLIAFHGQDYLEYTRQVPMLIPRLIPVSGDRPPEA